MMDAETQTDKVSQLGGISMVDATTQTDDSLQPLARAVASIYNTEHTAPSTSGASTSLATILYPGSAATQETSHGSGKEVHAQRLDRAKTWQWKLEFQRVGNSVKESRSYKSYSALSVALGSRPRGFVTCLGKTFKSGTEVKVKCISLTLPKNMSKETRIEGIWLHPHINSTAISPSGDVCHWGFAKHNRSKYPNELDNVIAHLKTDPNEWTFHKEESTDSGQNAMNGDDVNHDRDGSDIDADGEEE
jgi:hypothetical protein